MSDDQVRQLHEDLARLQDSFSQHRDSMRWINGVLIGLMTLVLGFAAHHMQQPSHPGVESMLLAAELGLRADMKADSPGEILAEIRTTQRTIIDRLRGIEAKMTKISHLEGRMEQMREDLGEDRKATENVESRMNRYDKDVKKFYDKHPKLGQ